MKLKEWPTDDLSYLRAIRQTTKFISLIKATHPNPNESEDLAEALEIYCKLVRDIYKKHNIQSNEEFWKWCYSVAEIQLDMLEERLS